MTAIDISAIKNFPTNGKIQIINKNIYVITRKYIWDKEHKTTKEVRETLGKIVDNKYYPMDEYHRLFDRKGNPRKIPKLADLDQLDQQQMNELVKKVFPMIETGYVGCIPILYSIAYKIGIWDDLVKVYGSTLSQHILALAIYFIVCNKNTAKNYSNWTANHLRPDIPSLSSQDISKLYAQLGADQKRLDRYKFERIERYKNSNLLISIDSTTVASDAINMEGNALGYNKEKVYESQINVTVIFDNTTHQPLMHLVAPGNISDMSMMIDSLNTIKEFRLQQNIVSSMFDRGYCSLENLKAASNKKVNVNIASKLNNSLLASSLSEARKIFSMGSSENLIPNSKGIYGHTNKIIVDGIELWVHIYYSPTLAGIHKNNFLHELYLFKEKWLYSNDTDRKKLSKESRYKFFTLTQDQILNINYDKVNKETENYGYFASISNFEIDHKTSFEFYGLRRDIEYVFKSGKQNIDLNVTRVHNDTTFQGKLLINMVALSILEDLKLELSKNRIIETKGRKKKKISTCSDQFTVEDVISTMAGIGYKNYKVCNIMTYTPITEKQHLISAACGFPDLYKSDVFKFKN